MRSKLLGFLVVAGLVMGGCATQPPQGPINLAADKVSRKDVRIGVAMTPLPKPDTHLPGAACLLCIAAARTMNSSLIDHSQTLPTDDVVAVKEDIAARLRKKGATVVVIAEPIDPKTLQDVPERKPNVAAKNFSPLREKLGVDKLVVIDVAMLGMIRPYSAYIPTSDPKAVMQGRGFMVDLATNELQWYAPLNVTKASDKQWDEPPKFPGLTNAYYQAVEVGKDTLLQAFE